MDNLQTFEEFLAISSSNIPVITFTINLVMATILASILRWVYINFGISLSNRRMFAKNFVIISLTTMVIITIVKASLALSLGLVGALSIVRFRAAIKEPEELSYLFLAIAIGLGFGANQALITTIGFILITLVIIANSYFSSKSSLQTLSEDQNLFLRLQTTEKTTVSLDKIISILSENCDAVDIKRFDESQDGFEGSFLIEVNDISKLTLISQSLQNLEPSLEVSFIDYNQPI